MALLKGTLDVLVLKALTTGPMHGFEITRWIEDGAVAAAEGILTGTQTGALQTPDGDIPPVL